MDSHGISHFQRSARYQEEWRNAPKSFLRRAEKANIKADDGTEESNAIEFDPLMPSASYTPDMSEIDSEADRLVEKYGAEHEVIIRSVLGEMKDSTEQLAVKHRAFMLGHAAMMLVKGDKKNTLARIHALLHAIPLLAQLAGFSSMRKSAIACGCSQEWIRRNRDWWCDSLRIPIPESGQKSPEAKAKYKQTNGHRKVVYRPEEN